MKRYGNLWDEITSIENIQLAFNKAKKGKGWQNTVKRVEDKKDIYLENLQDKLLNHSYYTSKYKEKVIYEPKQRIIYVLPFYPDRIAQHAVMNVVAPIWDRFFIKDSYACRKNKGQHAGSKRAMQFTRRNKYCLQCDVSKFYPSINHDVLMEIISRKIKDKNVLWLLGEIISSIGEDSNVPIGNYTSQWFGNLYLNELDQLMKHKYHVTDYIRYCDDFLMFSDSKEQLREWGNVAENFIKSWLKMKLSKKSIFPTTQGVDFLGYRHFPDGKILIRKSTAKRQKQTIKEIPWLLSHGRISKESALSKVASIKGWLMWADTYNLSIYMQLDRLEEWIKKYDGRTRFEVRISEAVE
jgi:retron-type reverse transcriptase